MIKSGLFYEYISKYTHKSAIHNHHNMRPQHQQDMHLLYNHHHNYQPENNKKRSFDHDNYLHEITPNKINHNTKTAPSNEARIQNYIENEMTIEILKEKGIDYLYPIQYKTYDFIYQGFDMIARDKTGSGKTLAFSLPIIERFRNTQEFDRSKYVKFLIVLPTRELAMQVKDQIDKLKIYKKPDFKVLAVYGKSDIEKQIEFIGRGIDIIVGTPGRLVDLMERDVIKMHSIKVVCLDQADEMLKQGFKEEIEKIYKYIVKHTQDKVQNLLFSATVPPWLQDISTKYQDKNRKYVNLISEESKTPETLKHMCMKLQISKEYLKAKIIKNLLIKYAIKTGNVIIFCERKNDVQRLSNALENEYDVKNEALHSDVPQSKRERAYRNFKAGSLKCLIATNVAARGLDFPDIDLVIQVQPPSNVEPYIHRSGRTARRGKEGICITIYNDRSQRLIRNIEEEIKVKMVRLQSSEFLKRSEKEQRQMCSGVQKERQRQKRGPVSLQQGNEDSIQY